MRSTEAGDALTPARLDDLRCPHDGGTFTVQGVELAENGHVRSGRLVCTSAGHRFEIRDGVARFRDDSGYAASFGDQWNRYRRTQLDSVNGSTLSASRFYSGTRWRPAELRNARVLEVGCGAGRFTEIMLAAGAVVSSLDYSSAVDACYANHGADPRLSVVQGDLFALPFEPGTFDFVFCYGVLQHTPDPKKAFFSLVPYLKPGGCLAVDSYRKGLEIQPYKSKYLFRPITTRMSSDRLFALLNWYIPKWLPFDTVIKKMPVVGPALGMIVPCWNYSWLPLSKAQQTEWSVLDTFDALAPKYDLPQTVRTVRAWFEEAGLERIDVREGGNGVLGNGRRGLAAGGIA
jgi:SAM-dependent methyltransferase